MRFCTDLFSLLKKGKYLNKVRHFYVYRVGKDSLGISLSKGGVREFLWEKIKLGISMGKYKVRHFYE